MIGNLSVGYYRRHFLGDIILQSFHPTHLSSENVLGIAADTGLWIKPVQYERKARPFLPAGTPF
jgi:hypothetical protein